MPVVLRALARPPSFNSMPTTAAPRGNVPRPRSVSEHLGELLGAPPCPALAGVPPDVTPPLSLSAALSPAALSPAPLAPAPLAPAPLPLGASPAAPASSAGRSPASPGAPITIG